MTESHFARLDVHFRTDALSSNASQRRAVSATCGDASGVGRLAAEVEGGESDDPTRASRPTGGGGWLPLRKNGSLRAPRVPESPLHTGGAVFIDGLVASYARRQRRSLGGDWR